MSDTGKQSPLGTNVLSSLLINQGLTINPIVKKFVGTSKTNSTYTPGALVNYTCLKWLTYAINDAYVRGYASGANQTVSLGVYNNLINIGTNTIPALGNTKPPSYNNIDPTNLWQGEATTGYSLAGPPYPSGAANIGNTPGYFYRKGPGQGATWYPWNSTWDNVSVTQWAFLRCVALQAWNDFNWNGTTDLTEPEYNNFAQSFNTINGFIKYSNESIMTVNNSKTFAEGTYSNMNDMMTADISGVSLSTQLFGQDLINLGNAIDLGQISVFGLPSALLATLQVNNALTQPFILALLIAGLSPDEITSISTKGITPTVEEEKKIYAAMLIITGEDLTNILQILKCKTQNLEILADLLNVKKMFPLSYSTLTVPIYNSSPGPTNSKTYYLLFIGDEMNPQLVSPNVVAAVGSITPASSPTISEPPSFLPNIEQKIVDQVPIPPIPNPTPMLDYFVEQSKVKSWQTN